MNDYRLLNDRAGKIADVTTNAMTIRIIGSVTEAREITTKNGRRMAFVKLADTSGEIELVVFPGVMESTADTWKRDAVLLVKGKVSRRGRNGDDEPKILVDSVENIEDEIPEGLNDEFKVNGKAEPRVYIRIANTDNPAALSSLKTAIDKTPGLIPVVLVAGKTEDKQIIKLPSLVEPDDEFMSFAQNQFGEANVRYQ